MVGTIRDELNCCLKCLPKDYTVIHPETKFIANAGRNDNTRAEHNWILVEQIFMIGRKAEILYFLAKQ